jgi:drug/metabolite transporter (DMT)-like permease
MNKIGVMHALSSAALFGASTPAAKLLVGTLDPFVLAGLLYCGAGIGVAMVRRLLPGISRRAATQVALARSDIPWLTAAILAGGVMGPLLLMWGSPGPTPRRHRSSLRLRVPPRHSSRGSYSERTLIGESWSALPAWWEAPSSCLGRGSQGDFPRLFPIRTGRA